VSGQVAKIAVIPWRLRRGLGRPEDRGRPARGRRGDQPHDTREGDAASRPAWDLPRQWRTTTQRAQVTPIRPTPRSATGTAARSCPSTLSSRRDPRSGLVLNLLEAGEAVVEVGSLKRARGAKNDRIDAIRAARQAIARDEQGAPRAGGLREALRMVFACREGVVVSRTKAINELKSLIVVAPEQLRAELRGRTLQVQLTRIEQLPTPTTAPVEHRLSVLTLQSIAARIRFLSAQLAELDPQLLELITQHPAGPALLAQAGVGPVVAAQLLISWSHPGRVRSEAAFASLAGVAPLEVSSGQRSRHRLNRGGDRALNRALHTVAITRMRCHPETRAYETRRNAEGKTHRDVRRSVKRALARRLYRPIETATRLHELPNAP